MVRPKKCRKRRQLDHGSDWLQLFVNLLAAVTAIAGCVQQFVH